MGNEYDPINLLIFDAHNYDNWFKNEESSDTIRKSDKEESEMTRIEGVEEEVKKEQDQK